MNTCSNILTHGHWVNFSYNLPKNSDENSHFQNQLPLFDKNGSWSYSGVFLPGQNCYFKKYTQQDIKICLEKSKSKNNLSRPIYILGDSRARIIFRILATRWLGKTDVSDAKIHKDFSIGTANTLIFQFYWSEAFERIKISRKKKLESRIDRLLNDIEKRKESQSIPQLVIIGEQFLHTVEEVTKDRGENVTVSEVISFLDIGLLSLERKILPKLTSLLSNCTIIVLASEEPLKFKAPGHSPGFTSEDWQYCQDHFNRRLSNILSKYQNKVNTNQNKISLMTNNLKTAWSLDNKISLLPDGSHKLPGIFGKVYKKGDGPTSIIPDSLYVDSDLIYNYHCGQFG